MDKQTLNKKLQTPFIVGLVGVLILAIALFLPYLTAVGEMAEYIKHNPDRVEFASLNLTAGDLANVPIISVSKLITGVYGENDGQIANIIVLVFCGLSAFTAVFVVVKKPIAVMIFDLLAGGTFFFLTSLMKDDFIDADKYARGIGYYAILIAAVGIFASAVWMLVIKIAAKKQLKAEVKEHDA